MWSRWELPTHGAVYGDLKPAVPSQRMDEMTLAEWNEYVSKLRRALRSAQMKVCNEKVIKAMLQHIMEWSRNKINTKMASWARGKRQFWILRRADPTLSLTTVQVHSKNKLVDVKVLEYDGQGARVQVRVKDTTSVQFVHQSDQRIWNAGELKVHDVLVCAERPSGRMGVRSPRLCTTRGNLQSTPHGPEKKKANISYVCNTHNQKRSLSDLLHAGVKGGEMCTYPKLEKSVAPSQRLQKQTS